MCTSFQDDLRLWLPCAESPPADLDLETSRFILKQVGDHFCDLLVQEKEACAEHMSEGISSLQTLVNCSFFLIPTILQRKQ